jgi:hypothetical protein
VRIPKCTVGRNELKTPTQKPATSVRVENTTARPDARIIEVSALT